MRLKLNKITGGNWPVFIILAAGVVTHITGLGSPFQGDDNLQIVNNPAVHSVGNIATFFQGGTFYYGHLPLSGVYYRPIVTTVNSLVFTIFGPNPVSFHLLQLALCLLNACLVYVFFTYSMKRSLALLLSLIFLLHPANSQVVYAIPYLQDALFFFFGIVALCLLPRMRSIKSLFLVGFCLTLALFSKETGILFILMAMIYLIWWDRRRLYPFLAIIALPIVVYLSLKAGATGLNTSPNNAPIDLIGLGGRVLTAPSIFLFYVSKLVWPVPLASGYYWTNASFSFQGVVVPFVADVIVVASLIYVGRRIRTKGTAAQSRTYWFFAAWAALGFLAHLQMIPLDETASETYLYFPIAGILGMAGIAASTFSIAMRVSRPAILGCMAILLVLLGLRSAIRGTDWNDPYKLAAQDIVVSPDDYVAEVTVAYHLAEEGKLNEALTGARRSVQIFPTTVTYNVLGIVQLQQGDYSQARHSFLLALTAQQASYVYDNLGLTAIYSGGYSSNRQLLLGATQAYPADGKLWLYLAILDEENNDNHEAKVAIANAYALGAASAGTYNQIMADQRIILPLHPTLTGS